jgi:hypothetical protein
MLTLHKSSLLTEIVWGVIFLQTGKKVLSAGERLRL